MSKPKVMVAVRDSASVESLVTLACQMAQGMEANLVALHVVEVPPVTPIEATEEMIDHAGKEVLAKARHVAEKFTPHFSTELLRARDAGEAIVGEAREKGMDLLVIGHHKPHAHPVSETLFGGTVRYVAHHAPCRVIVQVPPPDPE